MTNSTKVLQTASLRLDATDNGQRYINAAGFQTELLEGAVKTTKRIFSGTYLRVLTLILIAAALGSYASAQTSEKMPVAEYYGVYYVQSGKLYGLGEIRGKNVPSSAVLSPETTNTPVCPVAFDLRQSPNSENLCRQIPVQVLQNNVQYLVFSQDALATAKKVTLERLSYVRNLTVTASRLGYSPRTIYQVQDNGWEAGILSYEKGLKSRELTHPIPLLFKPVEGRPDMVLVVPSTPLKAGMYLLYDGEGVSALSTFVINPLREGEGETCVDVVYNFIANRSEAMLVAKTSLVQTTRCNDASISTSTPATLPLNPQPSSPGTTLAPSVAQPPAVSTEVCVDYISCTLAANAALRSSRWTDATAAWDKALSLGGSLALVFCHEGWQCEEGAISLGPKEISFVAKNGQKLFAVPPSQVTPSVVQPSQAFSNAALRVKVEGKNYNFEFVPLGVTCQKGQCPPEGIAQQLTVANYVAQAIPKLASGALGPPLTATSGTSAPNALSSSKSANLQLAEQVRKVIASYETPNFHSPLDDEQLLQSIISESQASGVSLWLLFGQAKFETTFGDPINTTVRDGMTFTDGSTGNAHNVFNIRPGASWAGKVLDTGRGGKFRVYASYEDSVRDYLSLMSSNLYKGKSLDSLVNTYFPPGENGPARVEEYITSVIQTANKLGFTVDRNSVPVP